MSDPWAEVDGNVEALDERGMDDLEQGLAEFVYAALQRKTNYSDRALQAKANVIGISELGVCQERTRRLMAAVPEPESDKLEAFIGTALGDHVEDAIVAAYAEQGETALRQQLVSVDLEGDGGTYTVYGHPDIVLPSWGVIDAKSADGLGVVRKLGPSRQQHFQRNLYCKGAHVAGLLEIPLEQAKVANVWIDRSGRAKELFVNAAPYSEEVVREATMWLDEVVYAYRQGEEAMKEPPRNWCEKVCGHFPTCRQYDSDVSGLILDDEVMAATVLYDEGRALARRGELMKEEAKGILVGLDGYVNTEVGRFQIRSNQIGASEFTVRKKPSVRLEVRRMKD